jgi:hypothetical protein
MDLKKKKKQKFQTFARVYNKKLNEGSLLLVDELFYMYFLNEKFLHKNVFMNIIYLLNERMVFYYE